MLQHKISSLDFARDREKVDERAKKENWIPAPSTLRLRSGQASLGTGSVGMTNKWKGIETMRKLVLALIVSMLLAVPVFAGPLVKSQVSSTANWVVHADYERFFSSQVGGLIRKELASQGIEEKLANFATIFSFHPLYDVCDVTIYGNGREQAKAAVLIDGRFDKEKLEALVRMNPQHQEVQYGDITIHGWLHEEKKGSEVVKSFMMYGCVYQNKILVISSGLDTVKQAVDVMKGSAQGATDSQFGVAALNAQGAFFQAAATGVSDIAGEEQQAAVLKQTDKLGLAIGENAGKFYIDLGLITKNEETAQSVNKVLEGIIAFATLSAEQQPKLAELAQKVKLSCAQNNVGVHFESDPESVFQFLKEQWEKKKQASTQTQ